MRDDQLRLLRELNGSLFAMEPTALAELLAAAASPDLEARTKEFRDKYAAPPGRTAISRSGVALVPVHGTISHRARHYFGGTSCEHLAGVFGAIAADDSIGTIVLDMNTPGGSVYGVPELAAQLRALRASKRIIAVANALSASAGYWIGSAAHEFVVTPSGEAGSIGVFATHIDVSKALEEFGVKVTLISEGTYKVEGNPFEALSEEARAAIQASVADYYGMFVRAVAENRGVSEKDVRGGMGEGRVLTAQRALAEKLVDRVATLDEVLAELGVRAESRSARITVPDAEAAAAASSEPEPQPEPEPEPVRLVAEWPVHVVAPQAFAGEADASTSWLHVTAGALAQEPDEDEPDDDEDDEPGRPLEPETEGDTEAEDEDEPESAAGGADRVDAAAPDSTPPVGRESTVNEQDTAAQQGAATPTATVGHDAGEAERKRCQEIVQLCAAHGMAEKAAEFITAGYSADRAGREILQLKEAERPGSTLPQAKPPVELTEQESKRYSLSRFAMAAANGRPADAGFEWEVHEQLVRDLNYSPKGIMVPTTLGIEGGAFRRSDLQRVGYQGALTTGTAGGGQELVFIEPGSFIELLRSRLVTAAMGATFLPGLRGNVDFPKQTGAGEFEWVPESNQTDTPADSDLDTGVVSLRPKNGRSITSFSRTLLAQGVINVEQLVRADLAAITARGIDRAALHGSGQGNEPAGIYAASGVNPVAFGGAISFPKVVEMETRINENDADIATLGYVATPGVRGAAKTTLTFPAANTGAPIWTGGVTNGEMNGFRAMASTQLSKKLGAGQNEHGLVFGAWAHLLIGEWGAMDILVDPYTRGGRGLIRMIVFSIADVALRYPEAFSKATGLTVATDAS